MKRRGGLLEVVAERITVRASSAAVVFAPVVENDMAHEVERVVAVTPDVTATSTLPEAGTIRSTSGPAVPLKAA